MFEIACIFCIVKTWLFHNVLILSLDELGLSVVRLNLPGMLSREENVA